MGMEERGGVLPGRTVTVESVLSAASEHDVSLKPTPEGVTAPGDAAYPRLVTIDASHYVLGREISKGGMGRIWIAKDRRLDRSVAIKEVLRDSRDLARRLEREARITAQLQHPSIVSVHEAGEWSTGTPFYAMPYIEGESLDEVLRKIGSLEDRLALVPHVLAVADAIAYAHRHRIIHRDLKPKNVMVGPFGETIVIDWGLAKNLNDPAQEPTSAGRSSEADTRQGTVLGTPAYMPPEQARGPDVDERADVYSLGAILYEVLAGRSPHGDAQPDEILARLRRVEPPTLLAMAPSVPADLAAIVTKAIAREPADRYPSAKEFADDLRRFHTGLLVGAHRYTFGQLVRRFLRRNRVAVAVAGILLLILAGLSMYGVLRIVSERDAALHERNVATEQRNLAAGQQLASEQLVSFALGDLHDELVKVGRLQLLKGIAVQVERYYADIEARGLDVGGRSGRAQAWEFLGDVAWAQADRSAAAAQFRKSIALREALLREVPVQGDLQLELGRSHAKLGLALEDHDRGAAAAEYAVAESYLRPLATGNGPAPKARNELGTMLVRVADGLRSRGNLEGAVAAYRESIALRNEMQAGATPNEQLSFSQALDRLAMALNLRNEFDEALRLLERSRATRTALVAADVDNTELLSALQVTTMRLGQVLNNKHDLVEAERAGRAGVDLARRLSDRDPENTVWRDSLYVALGSLGQVYIDLRRLDAAQIALRESRDIVGELVAKDPTHKRRRRNLAIAENKLGLVCEQRRDLRGALEHYRAAIAIEKQLVTEDEQDVDSLDLLTADQQNVGNILLRQGDVEGAIALLRARVAGQERLLARDPMRAEWRQSMAEALSSLWQALKRRPAVAAEAATIRRRALDIVQALTKDGKLVEETRKEILKNLE